MKVQRTGWLVGLITLVAGACSSTGTVALSLTDAPPDMAAMSAVTVTLSRVEAHFAGVDDGDKEEDGGWRSLDTARSFDLLRLQHGVSEALGELELPEGKITQIRLFIDESGPNAVTLASGQVCALDLRAVDKTGVKISHPFKALAVEPGRRLEVVIDFDVKESVEQDAPCAFRLAPVIKIKSVKDTTDLTPSVAPTVAR
jgi:hypothetical protein